MKKSFPRPRIRHILRIVFALVATAFLSQFSFDTLEYFLYDLRVKITPQFDPPPEIVIVMIDQTTIEQFKRIPNFEDHAEALTAIYAQNPAAVAYVTPLMPLGTTEDDAERALAGPKGNYREAEKFAHFLQNFPHFYQLTDQMALKGETKGVNLPPPFEKLRLLSAPKTADKNLFALDGVTRRLMLDYQGAPLGHFQLAQFLDPDLQSIDQLHGKFFAYDSHQAFIHFYPPGAFHSIKFENFIKHIVQPQELQNKIVLIGDNLGKSLKSYVKTPQSREDMGMTLAEMHANMISTIYEDSAPRLLPQWIKWILLFVISWMTIYVVLKLIPLSGIWVLLLSALALFLFSWVSLWLFGIWIPVAQSYVSIFLCYYFFIPYRLIVENRRSWEFQQRNELLTQVEELKTNFISMMSHDLKTPIARIQGMTDLIVNEPGLLSASQREALDHIRSSALDLLKFISAILDYAQIRSSGVKLHFQAKDPNLILDEVIQQHEFLARIKRIEIVTEFEPMFPVKLDPHLMKQVFSNLLENAIKYSPDDSKILISTDEVESGFVRIQFADQGRGISADDLPHVFAKFFRGAEAKTSPIRGSGLGLYLAHYFVELHHGRLSVESFLGQGSTFTVDLPIAHRSA